MTGILWQSFVAIMQATWWLWLIVAAVRGIKALVNTNKRMK